MNRLTLHITVVGKKNSCQRVRYTEKEVPLHTLLAASAEVLPLQLCMLVVMVMLLLLLLVQPLMMAVMLKVRIDRPRRTGTRRSSVDNVLRRAFVDHVRVVAIRSAVVVLLSQMLWERCNQIFLLRHTDQTCLQSTNQRHQFRTNQ